MTTNGHGWTRSLSDYGLGWSGEKNQWALHAPDGRELRLEAHPNGYVSIMHPALTASLQPELSIDEVWTNLFMVKLPDAAPPKGETKMERGKRIFDAVIVASQPTFVSVDRGRMEDLEEMIGLCAAATGRPMTLVHGRSDRRERATLTLASSAPRVLKDMAAWMNPVSMMPSIENGMLKPAKARTMTTYADKGGLTAHERLRMLGIATAFYDAAAGDLDLQKDEIESRLAKIAGAAGAW